MKRFVAAIALASAVWLAPVAAADPLDYDKLTAMVAAMGHSPKPMTKTDGTPATKFEITITTSGFNVPMGLEVSPSGRYIWCTASLGASKLTGDDAIAALKKIGSIQPTTFWLTSADILMIGIAVDNRDVTPEHLKFIFDKLAGDVGSTASIWQKPATE